MFFELPLEKLAIFLLSSFSDIRLELTHCSAFDPPAFCLTFPSIIPLEFFLPFWLAPWASYASVMALFCLCISLCPACFGPKFCYCFIEPARAFGT